jgi:acyl-CoA thioesterase FadM
MPISDDSVRRGCWSWYPVVQRPHWPTGWPPNLPSHFSTCQSSLNYEYEGQLRLADSPLQVTIWVRWLRAVDFTLGYEVRSVNAGPSSKPAVIAETQLAAVHIDEQRLVRLSPHHRQYLQRWLR